LTSTWASPADERQEFIRSAIQLGWSRDAAVRAVDQAGELENTRFDLVNGRLVRL